MIQHPNGLSNNSLEGDSIIIPETPIEAIQQLCEDIGQSVSKYRKVNNLTQQQLGELVGVSYQTISKWECDLTQPDIQMLKRLSCVFHISIDEIVGNESNEMLNTSSVEFKGSLENTNIYDIGDKVSSLENLIRSFRTGYNLQHEVIEKSQSKSRTVSYLLSIFLLFLMVIGLILLIMAFVLIRNLEI